MTGIDDQLGYGAAVIAAAASLRSDARELRLSARRLGRDLRARGGIRIAGGAEGAARRNRAAEARAAEARAVTTQRVQAFLENARPNAYCNPCLAVTLRLEPGARWTMDRAAGTCTICGITRQVSRAV